MAGILIYKYRNQYYSFVTSSNETYKFMKESLSKDDTCKILWGKTGTTIDKIENARNIRNNLIEKLNKGEKINLEKELYGFFK